MSMEARQLRIHGLVQGVGFRWSMCAEARRLGLAGWVRNRRDGSVECYACGSSAALDALQAWAGHGPRGARVERVDAASAEVDAALQEFEQTATL
ncbi:MAG: acylphosphatase [Rhodocyclaceae bacterium]|nr:acylphosphatase [Rhodocyclaceae bacterium]MBX3671150.1 acylphosphatase [Rhodocyclaceae bacterium]